MTNIVDNRRIRDNSAKNRRRFLDRVKKTIKKQVDERGLRTTITKIGKSKERVSASGEGTAEPAIGYDSRKDQSPVIVSGNRKRVRGDYIHKPRNGGVGGRGGPPGDVTGLEDDFIFTLTRQEFMDIFFEDMELPHFVKQAISESVDFKWKKAGTVKEGMPTRLNVKKSMQNAIARRVASESENPPYIDEIDLRYDYHIKDPQPIRHAVVFFIMDVSVSMTKYLKDLAKRFFLLFYLFLEKSYDKVDIRFVRYHSIAEEVTEETFFYSTETGGTNLTAALELVNMLINETYDLTQTNIYVGMSSDAEHISFSDEEFQAARASLEVILRELLPKVQYFAYCIVREDRDLDSSWGGNSIREVLDSWNTLLTILQKGRAVIAFERKDIFPALYDLFKKGEYNE